MPSTPPAGPAPAALTCRWSCNTTARASSCAPRRCATPPRKRRPPPPASSPPGSHQERNKDERERPSSPAPAGPAAPAPAPTGQGLTASVTSDIPAVIAAGFDEAERWDPAHARTWVALVDGNTQPRRCWCPPLATPLAYRP